MNYKYDITRPRGIVKSNLFDTDSIDSDFILESVFWGVCSSDLKTYISGPNKMKYFGHEMVLKVIKSNLEELNEGDYVVPFHTAPFEVVNLSLDLSYKKYFYISKKYLKNLVRVNSKDSFKYVFLDSLSCIIHALNKITTVITSKSKIIILGNGFMSIIFQRVLNYLKVDYKVVSRSNLINDEYYYDICVDTTGSFDFINSNLFNIKSNGTIVLFSNSEFDKINYTMIREKEINIVFSKFFENDDVQFAIKLLENDLVCLNDLYTFYKGNNELKSALEDMMSKKIIRAIIEV